MAKRKGYTHGGPRPGSGRTKVVDGGRSWVRSIVDDPDRRMRFQQALDAALLGWVTSPNKGEAAAAAVGAYLRAFEHGYGRPPQALDVKVREPLVSGDTLRRMAAALAVDEGEDVV